MSLYHRMIDCNGRRVSHYYLCHYKPKWRTDHDKLSNSLLRFKYRNPVDVAAWTECAVQELEKRFKNSRLTVVRALGHDQSKPDKSDSLAWLCSAISERLNITDSSACLKKNRVHNKLSGLTRRQRQREMQGVYELEPGHLRSKQVLIVDDISTTATTINSIVSAIAKEAEDVRTIAFTLAICEPDSDLNINVSLKGGGYQWADQKWLVMEDEAITIEMITAMILTHDPFREVGGSENPGFESIVG